MKMNELLDDDNIIEKAPEKQIDIAAYIGFGLSGVLFIGQLATGKTSETALVLGSYIWIPPLVFGLAASFLPPKKALFLGVLTLPIMFLFYQTMWSAF